SELLVVAVRSFDCLREDRRVGGDPANAISHQTTEGAILQVGAGEIVQPGTLAGLIEEPVQLRHTAFFGRWKGRGAYTAASRASASAPMKRPKSRNAMSQYTFV